MKSMKCILLQEAQKRRTNLSSGQGLQECVSNRLVDDCQSRFLELCDAPFSKCVDINIWGECWNQCPTEKHCLTTKITSRMSLNMAESFQYIKSQNLYSTDFTLSLNRSLLYTHRNIIHSCHSCSSSDPLRMYCKLEVWTCYRCNRPKFYYNTWN